MKVWLKLFSDVESASEFGAHRKSVNKDSKLERPSLDLLVSLVNTSLGQNEKLRLVILNSVQYNQVQ